MIKGFIFDMDGVIIDSEPLHCESDRLMMRDYGCQLTEEAQNNYIGVDNGQMLLDYKKMYGIEDSFDEMVEKQHNYKLKLLEDQEITTIKGIKPLIAELKGRGIAIALASSSTRKFIDLILNKLGIDEEFDVIVSGEEVEKGKPAPDIFLEAAKQLGIEPAHCVVLEDAKHGVQAAKDAGMKCIAYKNPSSGDQDLRAADKIVSSIENLVYDDVFEDK